MSRMRRLLQALGLGGNTSRTTVIITGGGFVEIGDTVYDATDGRVSSVDLDLGPEVTRSFNALLPVDAIAVNLSKEVSSLGLSLRDFDAAISVVATNEVTAPVVTVTGPQRLVDSITQEFTEGFFQLIAPRQTLVATHQVTVKALMSVLTIESGPRVRLEAKVPVGTALRLRDTCGSITTKGDLGDLYAVLGHDTGAVFDSVTNVVLNTGSDCDITVQKMNGALTATLNHNTKLKIPTGSIGVCTLNTGSDCEVEIDAAVGRTDATFGHNTNGTFAAISGKLTLNTGSSCDVEATGTVESLGATLQHNTVLRLRGTTHSVVLNTGSDCETIFEEVRGTFGATTQSNSTLTVRSGSLTAFSLNTGSDCEVTINTERVDRCEATLQYNTLLQISGMVKKMNLNTGSDCEVTFESSLEELNATLQHNTTLKAEKSIDRLALNTGSDCEVTVSGMIKAGSLKAAHNTTVTAWHVEPAVDRSGMSPDSELIVTG